MCGAKFWTLVAILACLGSIHAQDRFQDRLDGYVPVGRPRGRLSVANIEQCQAACADDSQCKAFAFKSTNSACHLYDRVYPGGSKMTRNLGMRSSGLSIVPRRGYISAFKTSSFPPPPTWKR